MSLGPHKTLLVTETQRSMFYKSNYIKHDQADTMVIATYGLTGAGGNAVAQKPPRKLGLRHLDTGAIYRPRLRGSRSPSPANAPRG